MLQLPFMTIDYMKKLVFWSFHSALLQESSLNNDAVLNSIKQYVRLCIKARKVWLGTSPGEPPL